MNQYKSHIAFKMSALLIVLCLVFPYAVKFSHAFSHHEHEVCLGENQSHFHEIDIECEFYKFKFNPSLFFGLVNYEFDKTIPINKLSNAYYAYLKSHQQFTSYLRGPPLLM